MISPHVDSCVFSLPGVWLMAWQSVALAGGVGRHQRETRYGGTRGHGLSQQAVWVPFWTPKPLKRTPQDTQILLCGISKNLNLKLIIEFIRVYG